jgi:hypothetical protein
MAFLIILLSGWLHPFHVSVTNVHYKADQKVVQIEQSIFLDDFEEALRSYSGNKKLNITEDDQKEISTLIQRYIADKFQITVDGRAIPFAFVGNEIELEANVMWCYWEAEKVKKFDSFKLMNTILVETFSDQENIIHFKSPTGTKSERAGLGREWVVFGK